MNFASMLQATVTPLSERISEGDKNAKVRAKAKNDWKRDNRAANVAKHANALAKYQKAMGKGWVSTQAIETKLGYARGSCWDCLNAWSEAGILEKRKAGGDANWNRRKGYEWRLK